MELSNCGRCVHYHALTRGKRELARGVCLKHSTYASNKAGGGPYPPGAIVSTMPNGVHDLVIVRKDQVKLDCLNFKEAGK